MAHQQRGTRRPWFGGQGALRTDRRAQRVGGPGECRHHAVTLALLDRPDAARGADRGVEDLVVPRDGQGIDTRPPPRRVVEDAMSVNRK